MSYSTLYSLNVEGEVRGEKEYRNGHGYAMPIWSWLHEKYIKPHDPGSYVLSGGGKPVFSLRDDPRLEDWERICLWASFDWAIVKAQDCPELTKAFRRLHEEFKAKLPDHVCHYGEMANDIDALVKSGAQGVAFWATSVAADDWGANHGECTCACGNVHDNEEPRPYNINVDARHFFMFEEMEAKP